MEERAKKAEEHMAEEAAPKARSLPSWSPSQPRQVPRPSGRGRQEKGEAVVPPWRVPEGGSLDITTKGAVSATSRQGSGELRLASPAPPSLCRTREGPNPRQQRREGTETSLEDGREVTSQTERGVTTHRLRHDVVQHPS